MAYSARSAETRLTCDLREEEEMIQRRPRIRFFPQNRYILAALKYPSISEESLVSIKTSDVEKIAHLARIALSSEQIIPYTEGLNKILHLAEQMQSVDTTDVAPLAHPFDAAQRLRSDVVTEENHREEYLALAPRSEAGLYLVPQVIED